MARILAADDDPSHREFIRVALERGGHTVHLVNCGAACLAFLHRESPDLVLTEIFLPQVDGFELVREIHNRWPSIPIIGMTAGFRGLFDAYQRCFGDLFNAVVLSKPFSAADLIASIEAGLASLTKPPG